MAVEEGVMGHKKRLGLAASEGVPAAIRKSDSLGGHCGAPSQGGGGRAWGSWPARPARFSICMLSCRNGAPGGEGGRASYFSGERGAAGNRGRVANSRKQRKRPSWGLVSSLRTARDGWSLIVEQTNVEPPAPCRNAVPVPVGRPRPGCSAPHRHHKRSLGGGGCVKAPAHTS